jgi:hypothetical protein
MRMLGETHIVLAMKRDAVSSEDTTRGSGQSWYRVDRRLGIAARLRQTEQRWGHWAGATRTATHQLRSEGATRLGDSTRDLRGAGGQ